MEEERLSIPVRKKRRTLTFAPVVEETREETVTPDATTISTTLTSSSSLMRSSTSTSTLSSPVSSTGTSSTDPSSSTSSNLAEDDSASAIMFLDEKTGTAIRPGRYAKKNKATATACRAGDDKCRKFSRGHPTLSPGIFTLFCEHGICLGFESMKSHESPQVPFTIFSTRFTKAPSIIVYDNACHLHQYCLNREPNFFRDTIFVVDRMHQYNHRACSKGYKMDAYHGRIDIKQINSQVNEQANSGLARIKGQLAYMLPGNFTFHAALFLSLKNFHKKKKL